MSSHFGHGYDPVEDSQFRAEGLSQPVVGQLPSHLRIVSWSIRLQSQGTQKKHVMKTDDML